jgi:hypothetical protein
LELSDELIYLLMGMTYDEFSPHLVAADAEAVGKE